MWQFLEFLENSSFAVLVRDTPSVLAYSTVLAFHTFGMSFLVGLSTMIALRVLGFASGLPLAPLERFFRLIVIGFWVNAITGVVLLILEATKFLTNPDFYIKLTAIAGAIVSLRLLRRSVFGDPANLDIGLVSMKAKIYASTMLSCWAIAITAGRLTAYKGYTVWRTAIAVFVVIAVVLVGRHIGARLLASYRLGQARVITSTDY